MIFRDEHGLVIASTSLKLPLSYLVDEAEDLEVVRTLEFPLDVGSKSGRSRRWLWDDYESTYKDKNFIGFIWYFDPRCQIYFKII